MHIGDAQASVRTTKSQVRSETRTTLKAAVDAFRVSHDDWALAISLAEKGASSWLTCRPISRHGFALSKAEFRDGLCLRYGWTPSRLPSTCLCEKPFTVAHALSCPFGGFPSIRHNEVRDTLASSLKRVAHNVSVEPHLQPITGERFHLRSATTEDQARLDVVASGVWGGRFERTFLDVRVFNPYAPSNCTFSLPACYHRHEQEKRRRYDRRIREVERSSFLPVVLSATGGCGKGATALLKRIAHLQASRSKEPYSVLIALLWCRLGFALLRASVMCLRGARRVWHALEEACASLAVVEARVAV